MKASIVRRLNALNHEFYQGFAGQFSRSREVLQPGIPKALEMLGSFKNLLDLGCGDARVGRALTEWDGTYVGVDFSDALLERGEQAGSAPGFRLVRADLTQAAWIRDAVLNEGSFDAAVLFSFLHHIPSGELRLAVLRNLNRLLKPGATCAISVWQLLHLERFRRKVVDWSEIGLRESDVEGGDILVDWRDGGHGVRYIHHFDRDELAGLCRASGLKVTEEYRSDGETGDLGLYVVCRLAI